MGHQITGQFNVGACQLTQCSCGRGALTIKGKVLLLSSSDISEMRKLFSGLAQPATKPAINEKLNRLTGGQPLMEFTLND